MQQALHPLLALFKIGEHEARLGGLLFAKTLRDERCPECGAVIRESSYKNAKLHVGGGTSSRWPDILANFDGIILHERVIQTLSQENLIGFEAHRIEIVEIKNKRLRQQNAPKLFLLEAKGKVDVDLNEFGKKEDGWVCPVCHDWVQAPGGPSSWDRKMRYVPKLETWDGSDFVKIRNINSHWTLCSRRFIDLACKHKWYGFSFGLWIPGVGIYHQTPPGPGCVSYWETDWFEKASLLIKAKYPDLFGLSEADAKKLLPSKPKVPFSLLPISQKKVKAQSKSKMLQNPRFDLIEAHFKTPVPQPLKELYQNREELRRRRFAVDVLLSQDVLARIGEDDESAPIVVECYEPIDGKTMESWGPGMENYIEFASDGGEGMYCIDPKESDPEVHLFIMDGGDLIPLEVPLSEFLTASRRINH